MHHYFITFKFEEDFLRKLEAKLIRLLLLHGAIELKSYVPNSIYFTSQFNFGHWVRITDLTKDFMEFHLVQIQTQGGETSMNLLYNRLYSVEFDHRVEEIRYKTNS